MKQKIKQRAISFINASEGKPLREKLVSKLYFDRAAKRGVSPIHISLGKQIARERGMNSGLGYLSLIARLDRGDVSVIPQLLETYPSDTRYKTLLENSSLIDAEVTTTGDSSLMRKAIEDGIVDPEDPTFQNYITRRIEIALNERQNAAAMPKNGFTKDKALTALTDVLHIFERAQKRVFLSSGTLLGAIRDKNFIEGDKNINLGVFATDMNAVELEALFVNSDFERLTLDENCVSLRQRTSRILVDIFVYTKTQELISYGTSVHRWWHRPFQIQPYNFLGLNVYIPENPENHLTERYGNWTERVLYFNADYDGPNHTFTDSLESLLYLAGSTSNNFRKGNRHYADQDAFALRDYFDIDYTHYVPQPLNKYAIPFPITDKEIQENEIALVFGPFDKFNTAQISKLKAAKEKGTYLAVGIFSDALIACQSSKPPEMSEIDRVNMVRALNGVDNAFLLETRDSIEAMIERLNPKTIIGNYDIPT